MKLEGRRSSERGKNAIDRGEQRKSRSKPRDERSARRQERERDRASRQLRTIYRGETRTLGSGQSWLITNEGEHQRLPRVHVGNQLCPEPSVRVSPRESLMLSCVDDQLCPDPAVRVSPR